MSKSKIYRNASYAVIHEAVRQTGLLEAAVTALWGNCKYGETRWEVMATLPSRCGYDETKRLVDAISPYLLQKYKLFVVPEPDFDFDGTTVCIVFKTIIPDLAWLTS